MVLKMEESVPQGMACAFQQLLQAQALVPWAAWVCRERQLPMPGTQNLVLPGGQHGAPHANGCMLCRAVCFLCMLQLPSWLLSRLCTACVSAAARAWAQVMSVMIAVRRNAPCH
jgi:hypothetical protein